MPSRRRGHIISAKSANDLSRKVYSLWLPPHLTLLNSILFGYPLKITGDDHQSLAQLTLIEVLPLGQPPVVSQVTIIGGLLILLSSERMSAKGAQSKAAVTDEEVSAWGRAI